MARNDFVGLAGKRTGETPKPQRAQNNMLLLKKKTLRLCVTF